MKNLNDISTDLRPISLTPTLAKICERFIADWLMKLIIDKIEKRQYGSLKRSSTTHTLLSFIHHLLSRSDEPKNVIRIFLLDFAKAFDHIDHKILLRKLSSMEVPPIIISWITLRYRFMFLMLVIFLDGRVPCLRWACVRRRSGHSDWI